jgi:hypothetical protein
VFSERTANYEAFCQMKAKEKFKNRQRTLKKYRFNIEDDKKGQNVSCQSPFNIGDHTFFCAIPLLLR